MRQSLEYREQRDGGFFDWCKKSVIGALLVSDKKTHEARGRLIRKQKNSIGARLVRGCLPSLGLRSCNHYSNPRGGTICASSEMVAPLFSLGLVFAWCALVVPKSL
jgi:hypothetical protein